MIFLRINQKRYQFRLNVLPRGLHKTGWTVRLE